MTMSRAETELLERAQREWEERNLIIIELRHEIQKLREELKGAHDQLEGQRFEMHGYKSQLDRALGWIDCKMDRHPTGEGNDNSDPTQMDWEMKHP